MQRNGKKFHTLLEKYRNTSFKSAILTAQEIAERVEIKPVFFLKSQQEFVLLSVKLVKLFTMSL